MNKLVLALVIISPWATADILMRDGATCTIPEGYNVAQYDAVWNKNGMEEFCEFPNKSANDAFLRYLGSCGDEVVLEYPLCEEGLDFSSDQGSPCYELRTH
jgi:hypothetical protein